MIREIVISLLVFQIGCSHLKQSDKVPSSLSADINPQDFAVFEQAFHDMERGFYVQVIPVFEKLAQKYENTSFQWVVLYNLTNTYRELNQCQRAKTSGEILMKIRNKATVPENLQAQVYLLLAYIYECLNKSEQVLSILKEGLKYNHLLMNKVRLVEYPARLALAYIRLGKERQGQKIYEQVYSNLDTVKKGFRISSEADKIFSRHFYVMGRSYTQPHYIQWDSFLKVFPYHQLYLTQSILLESGKWSKDAEEELILLYRKLWFNLRKKNNISQYAQQVKKILNELKMVARRGNSKAMNKVYAHIRRQTHRLMSGLK